MPHAARTAPRAAPEIVCHTSCRRATASCAWSGRERCCGTGHAGMAAAYSNRLGNTWKSLGKQAATDNGVSNNPLKKSGGPMLLKSRLDKLRGQLNASATSAKAKASIVNRKVRQQANPF